MRSLVRSMVLAVAVAALASGCLSWRSLEVEAESARCVRGGGRWVAPLNSIPICEHQAPGYI
jgi:hypothetical protein